MRRSAWTLTRRRSTALGLMIVGAVFGAGVMRSAGGAVAAVPPTGTGTGTGNPGAAHTPGTSHARGVTTGGAAGHTPGAGARTPSPSHSGGATHTAGTGTPGATPTGATSHTPSPSHAPLGTPTGSPAPGAPAGSATSPDDRFVRHLYTDLVGAQDSNGEAYWVSQLAAGASRASVAYAFTQTDAYRGQVVGALYQQVMHRPVDPAGSSYWIGRMAQGLTAEQLAASLAGSNEWFANPQFGNSNVDTFIAAVYQNLLGRAPDAPGAGYWHNFLVGGGPRWQLTLDFAYSQEWAGQTVTRLYTRYHLGTPDQQGFSYWQGQIVNGMSDDQLTAQLLSSDQYYAWAQSH